MNRKLTVCLIAIIIAYYFFCIPQLSSAYAANYSIDYGVEYKVNDDMNTHVTYNIVLTNLNNSFYAASHSLTLSQTDIENVSVVSNYGVNLPFELNKDAKQTTLTTTFSPAAIGTNSQDSWVISYDTKSLASRQGTISNILIPGFGNKDTLNIKNLTINLITPGSLGSLNFSSPLPDTIKDYDTLNKIFTYNADKISDSGINVLLGNSGNYSFSFNYPIKNTTHSTQSYTFAIPHDNNNVRVNFDEINPPPNLFNIDNDGNYTLTYYVEGNTSKIIKVKGMAEVSTRYNTLQQTLPTKLKLSDDQKKILTSPMRYWESNDQKIKSLGQSITKGLKTDIEKERAIYNYLVKNFKYSQNALNDTSRQRKGALYAINNPKDVICQEYADTFVALSRSIGIPSRFIAGYADTISPFNTLPANVLHAWAEFFTPDYGWVPVDPTWGSTSGLDFFGNIGSDHFEIAKYGYTSADPALVLSFTKDSSNDKNIAFKTSQLTLLDKPDYKLEQNQVNTFGGFEHNIPISIKNSGNRVLFLNNSTFKLLGSTSDTTDSSSKYIFPSMAGKIDFAINVGNLLSNEKVTANIYSTYKTYDNTLIKKENKLPVYIAPLNIFAIIPVVAAILIFMLSYFVVHFGLSLYYKLVKNKLS